MDEQRSKLASAVSGGAELSDATRGVSASNSRRRSPDGFLLADAAASKRSKRSVGSTQLPTLLDISQIAEHLGVTVRHVRQLVAERRIPYLKWGKLLRFDPHEISSWLAGRTVEPLARGRPGRRAV